MGRPQRVAMLGLGAVALGMCVYLLLGMEIESSEQRLRSRDAAAPAAEGAAPDPTASRGAPTGTTEASPIESAPFAAGEERVPAGSLWSIVAVDEAGRPIADAEITVRADEGALASVLAVRARDGATARPHLVVGRTDAAGIFPVRFLPPVGVEITAIAGTRSALLTAPPPAKDTRIEVRLVPPREIRATVVDQAEQPLAGLIVAPLGAHPRARRKATGHTDANGVVRLWVSGEHADLLAAPDFRLQVQRPDGVFEDGPRVPWAPDGVTEARFVLRSAPSAVKVTVVDEAGQPVTATMRLLCLRPLPENAGMRRLEMDGAALRERSFEGPSVVIRGLEDLGQLELILRETGRVDVQAMHVLEAGKPLHEVVLRRGAIAPVVSLQLMDGLGQPLPDFACTVELEYGASPSDDPAAVAKRRSPAPGQRRTPRADPRLQVEPVRSDERGQIALLARADRPIELRLHWPEGEDPEALLGGASVGAPSEAFFHRSIPALTQGQRFALEPITIPERPLVVAGIVVDHLGRPLAGAEVRLVETPLRAGGPPPTREGLAEARSALRRLITRTDGDGRFQLRDAKPPAALAIVATLGHLRTHPVLVALGSEDVRIEIAPPGSIAGRGILQVAGYKGFEFQAAPEGLPAAATRPFSMGERNNSRSDAEGQFTIPDLNPGTYTVTLLLEGLSLLRVPGVIVRAGEVTRDPRLQDVVLGGDLELAELSIQDAQGAPIDGVSLECRFFVGERRKRMDRPYQTDALGKVRILRSPDEVVEIRASKEGYLPRSWRQAEFPFTATLSSGATFEATIEGLDALVAAEEDHPGFALLLELKAEASAGDPEPTARTSSSILGDTANSLKGIIPKDQAGTAIRGIAPGTYDVRLERAPFAGVIRATGPGSVIMVGGTSKAHRVPLGTLLVPEGAALVRQRYALPPDAKDLLRKPDPVPTPR